MRIRVFDAFTDRPFAGNPAAVCLMEAPTVPGPRATGPDGPWPGETPWPDETWLRQVAGELALSETAFAHPLAAGAGADWALRWFTPAVEVDLCGHATLATAYALYLDRGATAGTVSFASRSGILRTHTTAEGTVTLDFPAAELTPAEADPAGVEAAGAPPIAGAVGEAVGVAPPAVYRTGALGDLLAVLPDEATVRGLRPDPGEVAGMLAGTGARGLIVTAPAGDPASGYDFVSRFFAPTGGVPEDPVTGSAHTALAPYWSRRLGRDQLTGWQASARGGLVRTEVRGDRVHLRGQAVLVWDGTLHHGPRSGDHGPPAGPGSPAGPAVR